MIEVIYKEDKEDQETVQEPFSMPRNVRQIGLTNGDYRIYVEDYVYTFLSSLAEEEKAEGRGMCSSAYRRDSMDSRYDLYFCKGSDCRGFYGCGCGTYRLFRKGLADSFRMIKNSIFRSRKLWDGFLHSGRWYWR